MAGESPGARRHQAQRKGKELPFHEQRSSNKYYKSKQKSVITPTRSDKKGRPGTPPKPNPTPKLGRNSDIPQTADKKYYAGLPQAPTLQQLQAAERKKNKGKLPSKLPSRRELQGHVDPASELVIRDKDDVRPVMAALAEHLDGDIVVVEVASKELLRRARTALDLMVTREEISEDAARDVRFSLVEAGDNQALDLSKPPEPTETVRAEGGGEDMVVDPLAVLDGSINLDDDDGPSTAPTEVNVVETDEETAEEPVAEASDDDEEEEADADDDGDEASDDDDDAPAEESTEEAVADSVLDPDAAPAPEAPVLPIRSEHGDVEEQDTGDEDSPPAAMDEEGTEDSGAISVVAPQEDMETPKPKRRSRRSGRGS